jgi:hypothetical protein
MELEYEGDPAFLTGGIEALLITMGDLAGKVPSEQLETLIAPAPHVEGGLVSTNGPAFSTETIAAHLDAKTGPELVICALARLQLQLGKSAPSRTEILAEMKSATSYFKETMSSNLSSSLSSLVKAKRINQIAKDTYALSATERKKVEATVAEIG